MSYIENSRLKNFLCFSVLEKCNELIKDLACEKEKQTTLKDKTDSVSTLME